MRWREEEDVVEEDEAGDRMCAVEVEVEPERGDNTPPCSTPLEVEERRAF